ncbi:MAG: GGDEF domain-containing protein [Lachnospiraceae bacterium]|nr:GGDEF domain-containing protein [Lachnospiraceae bacterium]
MKKRIGKALLAFALILIFSIQILPDVYASEVDSTKTVRVGVFDSVFTYFDEDGHFTGYAYDYFQEISYYTGWKYEYVHENWTDLLDMLETGEIDILYDVSYLPDRATKMLYSAEPMGLERAFIYADSNNEEFTVDNPNKLDGKKVGITGNDAALGAFLDWEKLRGIKTEIIEYDDPSLVAEAATRGEVDAFVQTDAFLFLPEYKPLVQISQSNIYFAITKERPDIKLELDSAMRKIFDVVPDYNNKLFSQYDMRTKVAVLPEDELSWLKEHGTIRVGYIAGYSPFCSVDSRGKLCGALEDYLEGLKEYFDNVGIEYEAIPYESAENAGLALKNGQVDCVFPVEMRKSVAEDMDFSVSAPIMKAEVYAIVKKRNFSTQDDNVVAVPVGNKSFYEFVIKNYPNWTLLDTTNLSTGMEEVLCGNADCIITTNYRVSLFQTELTHNGFLSVTTGSDMEMCFAFNRADTELYSIISRYTAMLSEKDIYESLAQHAVSDKQISIWDIVHSYFKILVAIIVVILAIIISLLVRSAVATKKANQLNRDLKELLESSESQTMQLEEAIDNYQKADLERRTDFLTGLRNRQDLFNTLQEAVNDEDTTIYAMFMLDIDFFKSYNDTYGHVEGDRVLKKISYALRLFGSEHSIQFYRYGGEEILGVLTSNEGKSPGELADEIVILVQKLNLSRSDVDFPIVTVSVGYTCENQRYEKMIDKADEAMYLAKSTGKNKAVCYETDVREP